MSIIVEDMEMPKSCVECPLALELCNRNYKWYAEHPKYYNERHEDCPLIDVSHCDEIIKLQDKYAELQAKEIDRLYAELEVKGIVHRKKGKWLHSPTYWYYCSVCGREPPNETNITTKFCPNCGAEMENEDEYIKV